MQGKRKKRPSGGACELLTWKRQETWLQRQLQSVNHSSPGWVVAGMSICNSLLGTELEQVVLSVLVCLSFLVLLIFAPGVLWSLPKSTWTILFVILYIMVSLAIFHRRCRDVHSRWFSRLVTLMVRLYRFRLVSTQYQCWSC